ncbi:MAG: hypothetical protein ABGY11_15035 [Candidatus Thioglobus sp.]|jgi:hypothetical protein
MKHNLNDRFALSSDHYNWILTDKSRCKNNQHSYFPNLKQLSNCIVEIKSKDCLVKCDINLCNKLPTSSSYHSVIDAIAKELEVYFKEITNNER